MPVTVGKAVHHSVDELDWRQVPMICHIVEDHIRNLEDTMSRLENENGVAVTHVAVANALAAFACFDQTKASWAILADVKSHRSPPLFFILGINNNINKAES